MVTAWGMALTVIVLVGFVVAVCACYSEYHIRQIRSSTHYELHSQRKTAAAYQAMQLEQWEHYGRHSS